MIQFHLASGALALGLLTSSLTAQPMVAPYPISGADRPVAVAGAALSGWTASADSAQDQVEVRDGAGTLKAAVSRAQMAALLPWMTLDGSTDGPVALGFTDSGRVLFIAVRDDNTPGDGLPSGGVLRFEPESGDLRVFARTDLGGTASPKAALAHFKGRLYVGAPGGTRVYRALANDLAGTTIIATSTTPTSALTVDRDQGNLLAISDRSLLRAPLGGGTLTFAGVGAAGAVAGATDLAWSDTYGGLTQAGLYVRFAAPSGSGAPSVRFVPPSMARGSVGFNPTVYIPESTTLSLGAVAATATGQLLFAVDGPQGDGLLMRDGADARLSFEAWKADEFAQVVRFAKGLVSPDGQAPGWVIDADVQIGWTRFHPASCDGACWVVLACIMNDRVNGDPAAQGIVRTILQRYAGRAPDGIRPLRSADGIYWHWLDTTTGGAKAGWGDGYATLSTMKMVLAAARAVQAYPADAEIRASAEAIICGVRNWDRYISNSGSRPMAFLGAAAGGPLGAPNAAPFHEGIIFVEQAAAYGVANSDSAYAYWKNRANLPLAISLLNRPVTTGGFNQFQAAFVSLYSLLVQADLRADPAWRTHYANLRLSHAAWTDDNGPRYNTVFSAGTTRSDWGGYNADSLSFHPGDVATFTSLLALVAGDGASGPRVPEAVAAYHAYRRGARQTFLGGASILYRRSNIDLGYQPDSAGLPDVVLGALGLAELLQPGAVSGALTGPYPTCTALACRADLNGDGALDPDDLSDFIGCYFTVPPCAAGDYNGDGLTDPDDLSDYIGAFFTGC